MSHDMQSASDIDLLMIGKTGNGKSALGNSILRRKAFVSKSSSSSVTKDVAYEFGEHNGRKIKVVDGPGVGDTRMDNEKAISLVMGAMQYAISANPRGYHAFLLVVKFGGRFTAEDQDTIGFLKKIFGESFIKSYCILVMTCGDNFESESQESGQNFKQWCDEQDGVFQELLRECNNRVILFDNRTQDEAKKAKQISELIQMVDHLSSSGHRYNDDNFEKAKAVRDKLIIEAKKPMIKEDTMQETSLILYQLQVVQNTIEPEDRIVSLDELFIRAELLYETIWEKDNGTGALHDLVETVKSIQNTIVDEIKFSQRITAEKEKMRKQEAERERKYKEELKRQREEYELRIKQERMEDERRKELQRQQEKQMRELQERRRKEREEEERQLYKEMEREREKQRKEVEELERRYKAAKAENDEGIFTKVVKAVTWPFRKLFGLD
ncbi:unnamed protein product [Lymnaea stagnalis]|uniref:AIG1-type G domain-containing protein n=1 Tax=Lymnaea stagnalis TaxID=6523 RepID=A0AAV2HIT5_LYMST